MLGEVCKPSLLARPLSEVSLSLRCGFGICQSHGLRACTNRVCGIWPLEATSAFASTFASTLRRSHALMTAFPVPGSSEVPGHSAQRRDGGWYGTPSVRVDQRPAMGPRGQGHSQKPKPCSLACSPDTAQKSCRDITIYVKNMTAHRKQSKQESNPLSAKEGHDIVCHFSIHQHIFIIKVITYKSFPTWKGKVVNLISNMYPHHHRHHHQG
jgi:hypothetical protein